MPSCRSDAATSAPMNPIPTRTARAARSRGIPDPLGVAGGAEIEHPRQVPAWHADACGCARRSPRPHGRRRSARRRRGPPRAPPGPAARPACRTASRRRARPTTAVAGRTSTSNVRSPRSTSLDSGGRSYGASSSAPIRTSRPSKPRSRRVAAAVPPARPAPTTTAVRSTSGLDLQVPALVAHGEGGFRVLRRALDHGAGRHVEDAAVTLALDRRAQDLAASRASIPGACTCRRTRTGRPRSASPRPAVPQPRRP